MKIYAISGLGADERVFNFLTLNQELIPLKWIKPEKNESIESYSERFAKYYDLDKEDDYIILGVSFGGLIATEISKLFKPKMTILISSAETKYELNTIALLIGKSGLTNILPKKLFDFPRKFAQFLFGTDKKELLNSILNDTDLDFAKWAVKELVNWKNTTKLERVLKIGGSKDKLLPPKDDKAIIIENGEHFMIVDKSKEISKIINENIKNDTTTTPKQNLG